MNRINWELQFKTLGKTKVDMVGPPRRSITTSNVKDPVIEASKLFIKHFGGDE